ncbi:MAG: DUF4340 domain-containing protein, partial [Planctomycetes bacterium]|nr:DUF4340 domain-containing protein [Planctomycetota bacterium]
MNKLSRGNQILAAVLVVQIILTVVVLWPRGAAVAGGEKLFPALETAKVVTVSIRDAAGASIQLASKAGEWVLASGGDYPAKGDTVTAFLDRLVAMTSDRIIAETTVSQKQLKVADDDYNRLIEIEMEDGTQYGVFVGTAPTYGVSHVRVAGDNKVYLASNLTLTDASVTPSS